MNAQSQLQTPGSIHDAITNGNLTEVALLLQSNPDLVSNKDNEGDTPLHCAAFAGRKDAAELLLARGADVNAKDADGLTPLHAAAQNGHQQVVELLLSHKADVDAKDGRGKTALEIASAGGYQTIAQLLQRERPPVAPAEDLPLVIAVSAPAQTFRYAEKSADLTIEALRSDILKGLVPSNAATSIRTKVNAGKFATAEGPLLKLSAKYPKLGVLYRPIRRYAVAGLGYGCLVGVAISLFNLGVGVSQVNDTLGLAFIAFALSLVILPLLEKYKITIPPPFSLIPVALPAYIGYKGAFSMMLGAAVGGALLGCMPGMAIGAIVGTVRRRDLTLAYDAPAENAWLRILIPALSGVVIWVLYFYLLFHYFVPFLSRQS